ncbi:unnamed protein product, partial [Ectocarpus sp. 12 AP-2014]
DFPRHAAETNRTRRSRSRTPPRAGKAARSKQLASANVLKARTRSLPPATGPGAKTRRPQHNLKEQEGRQRPERYQGQRPGGRTKIQEEEDGRQGQEQNNHHGMGRRGEYRHRCGFTFHSPIPR